MEYRPQIKMKFSRWEIFLILMSLVVWIPPLVHYYYHRDNIPDIIIFKSNKPGQATKDNYFRGNAISILSWSAIGIYYFKKSHRSIYPQSESISRSVSRDVRKAEQQYRVENSFWFFLILIGNIFFSITMFNDIEKELRHGSFVTHLLWWFSFPLAIAIGWLIHHILWTRLSDE